MVTPLFLFSLRPVDIWSLVCYNRPITVKGAGMKPAAAIKPMQVKGIDLKYLGNEPEWLTALGDAERKLHMLHSFNWYNYHCDKKQAKQMLVDWLQRQGRGNEAKEMSRVVDSNIKPTMAWLCRINLLGATLNPEELARINEFVVAALSTVRADVDEQEQPAVIKPNIQDRLREKMAKAGGELEGLYDDMILAGGKMGDQYRPIDILQSNNVAPPLVAEITESWQRRLDELQEAVEGRDAQLVEGYSNHGRIKLRNMIRFAEQVIADCASYLQIKKVGRKPRKKKPVSPEKLTRRFKFLKDFPELGITSEPVTKLVNATEAWMYDTKRRKLIHVVADDHFKTFSVKGSALIGFDATHSLQKTLRRPAEQLKPILNGSAATARKAFRDIKAVETKFKGRSSAGIVLLRIR